MPSRNLIGPGRSTVADHWLIRWLPPALVVGALVVYVLHLDAYLFGTGEDGPMEWATVVAYVAAIPFAVLLARRWRRVRMRFAAAAYLLLAVGFLFVAGEEISWGQRVLGFGGPEAVVERNLQGEVNIHNLLGRYALHGVYIVIGLWGLGLGRVVTRLVPWLHPARLYAPGRELFWWFLPVVAYYVYVDYLGPAISPLAPGYSDLADGPLRFQEVVECILAIGLLLFVVSGWQDSRTTVGQDPRRPAPCGLGGRDPERRWSRRTQQHP